MPFEHACFVSYRHPPADGEIAKRFIDDLSSALADELSIWMKESVYLDRTRMEPGILFNASLAHALCQSICMVVVYTPMYFDTIHTFCAQEYRAMEKLEGFRLSHIQLKNASFKEQMTRGLIIPVIFRGEETLPPILRGERHYVSFERFALHTRKMKLNPKFEPDIREIVKVIVASKNLLAPWSDELTCDCRSFAFPTEDEVRRWMLTNIAPSPNFPLRSRV